MTPAHSGEEMLGGSQPQGKPRMDGKGHGNMAWSRDLLQELSGCDCVTTSHGTGYSKTSWLTAADELIQAQRRIN